MSNLEKHLISAQQSSILAEEYAKTNYVEINSRRPASKPDSKMYSIDLDVLQEYLKLISGEMDKRGIKNKGVQVCLGKYPEDLKDPKLNPEYLGYQMIFFSPTDLNRGQSDNRNVIIEMDASANLDDIPDLNYMNITPPY
ncbi:hypothetical protein IV494_03930 [Kaistella sp. G5-32]|uniref:Uncharacterized protein n=1 Tax=Kaistella gelatinilytica TaxID=2787636 RepID=A0ABS0F9E9_9FLAO|nr:hypothetical protein [Kaistella gelatinilytica]MBF8456323.1 hypothetical protein [Kaistella gelatinilytica]